MSTEKSDNFVTLLSAVVIVTKTAIQRRNWGDDRHKSIEDLETAEDGRQDLVSATAVCEDLDKGSKIRSCLKTDRGASSQKRIAGLSQDSSLFWKDRRKHVEPSDYLDGRTGMTSECRGQEL